MFASLKTFLVVTVSLLIGLGATWLYVRNSSLAEPVRPAIDHPFLKGPFPTFAAYAPVAPTTFPIRSADLDGWSSLADDLMLWIPVSLDQQGALVVKLKSASSSTPNKEIPLRNALEKTGSHRLVLDFLENRPGTMDQIISTLDALNISDRILIQSPIEGLLRDLREKKPRWIFGTSLALTTRLKMMSSIGLEAAVPIQGDVVVIEQLPKNLTDIPASVVDDAHRRHFRVIAGPVDSADDVRTIFDRHVDAIMVTDLEVLRASSTFVGTKARE